MTQTARHQRLGRALATLALPLALAGSAACTIENPCPAATRPKADEQRCVDAGELVLPDGSREMVADGSPGTVADARPPDARSEDAAPRERDAAPPSAPDTSIMPGIVAPPVPDAGPIVPQPTAGEPWPDHLVPVCWAPETVARRDFATLGPQVRLLAEQGWPRAANVQLQGFGVCAGASTGTLILRLVDGFTLEVTEGYLGRGVEHRLTVGVARKDLLEGLIPHALAHALALTDGPHAHDGCAGAMAKSARDALGECRPRSVLSFADRVRGRALYGALPGAKLDPRKTSFDGDRTADLVLLEPSGGGARVAVALSSGHDFAAAFSGTWAQLATLPSAVYGGDYNGDGLTDLGVYDGPRGAFTVLLSSGTSFDGPQAELWHAEVPADSKVLTGDFDHDGKTDLVFVTPTRQLRLASSTDTGFAPLRDAIPGQEFGGTDGRHMVGDFDGDGDIDLAYLEPFQLAEADFDTRDSIWLAVGEGMGFRHVGIIPGLGAGEFGSLVGQHYAIDLDNDGHDEFAYYEPGNGAIIPAGHTPDKPIARPPYRVGAPAALTGLSTPLLADFDGDGISDLVYLEPGTKAVRLLLTRGAVYEPPVGSTVLDAATISLLASSRDAAGR